MLDGAATGLEAVERHGEAAEIVATREDVGCVLVGDETGVDVIENRESIAEGYPLVPIVGVFADVSVHRLDDADV